jgi:hypothetical protein
MRESTGFYWVFFLFLLSVLAVILTTLLLRHRKQQMLHQERLAALEKGTSIPLGTDPAPWSPRVYLLRGLIWSFSGAAVIICLLGIALSSQRSNPMTGESLIWRAQNLSRSSSIPLDEAKQVIEKDQATEVRGMPAAVALLGALPLAVGLAYLVFYYTDESRKRLGAGTRPD